MPYSTERLDAAAVRRILADVGLTADETGVYDAFGRPLAGEGPPVVSTNPADGRPLGRVRTASAAEFEVVTASAAEAFAGWRAAPAPVRGEAVRRLGDAFRAKREALGRLVSLEMGKIVAEGIGEVQEIVDICDFAVGLSRQLYGLTMPSERPGHRLIEQWHPLGPVGVVTAFNFPVAVWAWNAALAAVCGDSVVWKPSSKTPLCAVAVQKIVAEVSRELGRPLPFALAVGAGAAVGEAMLGDRRYPLVSATGSVRMGRRVAEVVGRRLGRTLLELGGNNAVIVDDSADLDLALRSVLFGAVGTAGQRCTSTRRLIVHETVAERFIARLARAYGDVPVGDPLLPGTLMGPLVDAAAVDAFRHAVSAFDRDAIVTGGGTFDGPGYFVQPTIIRAPHDHPLVHEETFAPILYTYTFSDISDAVAMQNEVPQGLSSALFTERFSAVERFLGPAGSDCGIANVNTGTSGAEIGGAFGGEKDTGGGRESGSDAWKTYMRRQTCTLNGSGALPLAQGIRFGEESA